MGIGALVAFSGLLPPTDVAKQNNRSPVLLVHGADDRTIPSIASTAAAGQLRAAGFPVELETEPRVGHTISLTGADRAVRLLQKAHTGNDRRLNVPYSSKLRLRSGQACLPVIVDWASGHRPFSGDR
ncbi:alpha/beta hydrolase [Sinorhizobium medicae]|uniref:alpha/beta hydrolase n=1 Tax=Sinorhizobium medicae TaxID=110321 RepID=UPI002D7A35A1|nr:prolyl oligopeptidase family serine peptidase [Sinorhizobium medicae]